MSFRSLFIVSVFSLATAQLTPLASKRFPFANIPYQVTGDQGGIRGPQFGINQCNATTEGPNSNCQTLIVNDMADFCMWAPPVLDTIGNSEAREVAWCTQPKHGARLIKPGTIKSAQWLYAQNYVQIVGFLDQTLVNLQGGDMGGELDPHGADEQGNPLGALWYSNSLGDNTAAFANRFKNKQDNTAGETQVIEWIDFIGSNMFCLRGCNPNDPNAAKLCNHIYDIVGCTYNAVADYQQINASNAFVVCDSNDMIPPGIYTTGGTTTTWFQPQTGPVIPPYTPSQVQSSNCQTFASTDLFAAAISAAPTSSGAANPTITPGGSGSNPSGGPTSSRSGSAAGASSTSNGAATFGAPIAVFVGAIFGAALTVFA